LLLEGPDIEGLLVRVREEHGPSARIVAADKVRVGGLGGFFAKERFEVAVEIDPAPAPAAPAVSQPVAPAQPADLAALVDRAEALEARKVTINRVGGVRTGTTMTAAPADAMLAANSVAATGTRVTSTQGPAFADVLARLAHDVEPATAFTPAPGVTLPVTDQPQVPAYQPAATPQNEVAPAPALAAYGETTVAASQVERQLAALGVPAELMATTGDDPVRSIHEAIACLVSALPQPPRAPAGAGDVIVIVGEGTAAYAAAGEVARSLRLDPKTVLLAAPSTLGTGVNPKRLLSSPTDAARRAFRLHAGDTPVVVAVDAPMGATGARWARDVTIALRPDAVWAVADATRKTADVERHLARIGRVDGLVVHQAGATSDPASVLVLGAPVALLDGRRATRPVWTSVLTARLTGEEDDA
jgi:hypothetical protein